jgi:hypothetical protein
MKRFGSYLSENINSYNPLVQEQRRQSAMTVGSDLPARPGRGKSAQAQSREPSHGDQLENGFRWTALAMVLGVAGVHVEAPAGAAAPVDAHQTPSAPTLPALRRRTADLEARRRARRDRPPRAKAPARLRAVRTLQKKKAVHGRPTATTGARLMGALIGRAPQGVPQTADRPRRQQCYVPHIARPRSRAQCCTRPMAR